MFRTFFNMFEFHAKTTYYKLSSLFFAQVFNLLFELDLLMKPQLNLKSVNISTIILSKAFHFQPSNYFLHNYITR